MVRTPKTNNYLLNKYDIGEYAAVHNNYEKLVDLIYMRVGYIAEVISAVFNVKIDYFIFEAADNNHINTEYGDFYESVINAVNGADDFVYWELCVYPHKELMYYDKEGYSICLNDCFPYNWLFTDFEEELKRGAEAAPPTITVGPVIGVDRMDTALFTPTFNSEIINTLTHAELAELHYTVADVLYNIQLKIDEKGKEAN
ncbi:MAG: hypothetical protein WDA42_07800 [Candidatus Bathyarchaeia archaeon]|jgi:hypothetical protein